MHKICPKCKEDKELHHFHKDKTKRLGVTSFCMSCAKAASSKHYRANSEERTRSITSYSYGHLTEDERKLLSSLKVLCTKARNRKRHEHDLTFEYLKGVYDGQKGRCVYSGLPLSLDANQFNTMSLDRIDSQVGYIKGNVQLVCAMVNRMKQEFTEDAFVSMCMTIADNARTKTTQEDEPLGRDFLIRMTS